MSSFPSTHPQQICESLLLEEKRYNIEHNILRSENAIVDRLLARETEMKDVYAELHSKLHMHPQALQVFLGTILRTAAHWNPEKLEQARVVRTSLVEVNQQIARKAAELSVLLEQRSHLENTSSFSGDTHYDVVDVIEAASRDNHLFQTHVQEKLDAVRGQFDEKYWPSLAAFVQQLASDAEKAGIEATNPLTAAGTEAKRPSKADFFRVLFAAIKRASLSHGGQLPKDCLPTDRTLASLANCALDLDPDELVDADYVKVLRHRQRERSRNKSTEA